MTEYAIGYPFIITPFEDRKAFWKFVVETYHTNQIYGTIPEDAEYLESLGYEIISKNKVMCRPTDQLPGVLPEGYECISLDLGQWEREEGEYLVSTGERMKIDILANIVGETAKVFLPKVKSEQEFTKPEKSSKSVYTTEKIITVDEKEKELGKLIVEGYRGSICNQIFGAPTLESAISDMRATMSVYEDHNLSKVIVEKESGRIVALCLAGSGEHFVHRYTEIADLCVLPECRGKGLANYFLRRTITEAAAESPFVKLFVHVGDGAEYLYHKNGFISGPCFVNLEKAL